jgi:hypothetical protein
MPTNKIIVVNNTKRIIWVSVTNNNLSHAVSTNYFSLQIGEGDVWRRDVQAGGTLTNETVHIWMGNDRDLNVEVKVALPNKAIVIT